MGQGGMLGRNQQGGLGHGHGEVHIRRCGKWRGIATLGGTETLAVTTTISLGSKITFLIHGD